MSAIERGRRKDEIVKRIVQQVLFLSSWVLLGDVCQAQTTQPSAVDPDRATSGDLFWLSESGAVALPMTDTDVALRISGVVVEGRLTQQFVNSTGQTIEALYVFPLPDDAVVYAMEMRIGERRIVAEIREREQARREYDQARADGRKAALVDQHRPNVFRTACANILPGEAIRIELRFVQKAARVDDEYRLRFPLSIAPRYRPPGSDEPARGNVRRGPSAHLVVDVERGIEFERIDSPSHRMSRHTNSKSVRLEPAAGSIETDRDFLLSWKPASSALPQVVSFVETRDGERYALILLQPPAANSSAGAGLPTETLFVIDVSGSMQGTSIEQARQALARALERLGPKDRFNILAFNDECASYSAGFESASAEAVATAKLWIAGLTAGGGTAIYPALDRALLLVGDGSAAYASRIVFLTDGAVANEQEVLRATATRLGDTRLHTIGIGPAPNAYLMRKMAWHGHGLCEFIANVEQANNRIDGFFDRLDRPVWTDLELSWEGVRADRVSPARLPDLHLGEPLVLSARLDGGSGGNLTVGGWTVDGWAEASVEFDHQDVGNPAIALTWARAQVEDLMDSLNEGADPAAVRAQVVELALAFHLVTAYTSLVAVETFVGEARALPQTGTLDPLKRRLALLLIVAGLLGLAGLRKSL